MSSNFQRSPYLRTQRDFPPEDTKALAVQVDRSYIEIANAVNQRTIGLFALNNQIVTGETWYFKGPTQNQQSLRQIYNFTSIGNISHGIIWSSVFSISPKSYGTFTDNTNSYGCIYASSVAITGQVSFYVTPTNIVVLSGAGAPSITSGFIILEWISNP